jgi:hypothetical protein
MKKKMLFTLLLMLLLAACSPNSTPEATEAQQDAPTMDVAVLNAAVEATVSAELTRIAVENPSPTPEPATDTPEPTATEIVQPSPTISPLALDDHALFLADITIPDGTQVIGGEPFTKTWRLQNIGLNTWTTDYSFVLVAGELMDGFPVFLEEDVPPGGTVDISITMIAPLTGGTYEGYWMLANADGLVFGIGDEGNQAVLVSIVAIEPTAVPTNTPTATPTPTPSATAAP